MRKTNPFIDIFIILVGLFFLGHYFYKDKITSISDLKEIKGTVQNYSFEEDRGGRSTTYSYYIYLNEYLIGFQISAKFIDWFYKAKFENTIKQGDSLKILIPRRDYIKIGTREKSMAFGIESKTKDFLDPKIAIREYNSKTTLFFSFAFCIFGSILLYFDIKRKKVRMNKLWFYIKCPIYKSGEKPKIIDLVYLLLIYLASIIPIALVSYIICNQFDIIHNEIELSVPQIILIGMILAPVYEEILFRSLLKFTKNNVLLFIVTLIAFISI